MTDYTARRPEDVDAEAQATGARPDAGTPQTEQEKIAALVETLARENAEHKDRVLRTLAEMENLPQAHRARGQRHAPVRDRVVRTRRAGGR